MKKSFIALGLGALLLASCGGNKSNATHDSLVAMNQQYEEATDFNDSLMLLMGDIYTGLDSINEQEGLLYNLKGGENVDRREEIRQNLASLKNRLEANRDLLASMEAKLKDSNNQNAVLLKTIDQLKATIAKQDEKLAQLQQDLDNAQAQISDLTNQVAQGQEQLKSETEAKEVAQQAAVEAENEANRVYYAIGTNKELKKNGLLEKKFLGATKVLQGDFNSNYFTVGDKRNLRSIPTNGKKVKIWSNMPEGSYEIVNGADGLKTVKITNPNSFWSLSPYLIIQVD